MDAVLFVFAFDLGEQAIDIGLQTFHAGAIRKINFTALVKHGVDQPWINAEQFAKAFADFFITLEVLAFTANTPTRMQRGQQVLLVQIFQDTGDTCA